VGDKYEVEVKLRVPCESLDSIVERLLEAEGSLETETIEEDVYYQHPCRDMLATDEALRVRYTSGRPTSLTYKGPRIPGGGVKKRIEYNLPASEDLPRVLELLGFRPAIRIVKKRQYYRIPGAVVAVDIVEGLGCFVEVESQSADPRLLAEQLGIRGTPVEDPYPVLALEKATRGAARQ